MTLNLREPESREAQSRTKTKRKHWNPPAALAVPDAPPGYKYRWIRHEIKGQEDSKNIVSKLREGYELVNTNDLPEDYIRDVLPEGKYKGTVRVGDLMLAKIPEEVAAEKREYVEQRTERLQQSIDGALMAQQNTAMPIKNESKSSVSVRGRPDFQEE